MIHFPNTTFYKRHNNEISRYIKNDSSLHIINKNSKDKIHSTKGSKLYLDLNEPNFNEVIAKNKKYKPFR